MRRFALSISIGSLTACLLTACVGDTGPSKRLLDHHAIAEATVVGTRCNDHGRIGYQFVVEGRRYTNTAFSYAIDKACRDIRVGEPLKVYYDPGEPNFNTLMTPEAAHAHALHRGDGLIMIGVFALIALLSPFVQAWLAMNHPAFEARLRRGGAPSPDCDKTSKN
jgi:hypothetical protein